MKKFIILMFVGCFSFAMNSQAQEVWKEVRRLAKEVADNTEKDLQTRKIATFKIDALDYMRQRYYEQCLTALSLLSTTSLIIKLMHYTTL